VAYLRLEGYTQDEIAEIFRISRQTVSRDEKVNRRRAAGEVDEIDVKSSAGRLMGLAEHLTAKALREKDYALAWRIQRELVQDLQSLGYLPKAVEQHQVQLATFLDLARLAAETRPEALVPEAAQAKALPAPPDPCQKRGPNTCASPAEHDDPETQGREA